MGNFIGKLDNRTWKFSDAQSKLQRIIKLLDIVDDNRNILGYSYNDFFIIYLR